jgi:PhnB protein
VIFPIEYQVYGFRQGRLEDPFGHLWIIATQIEEVSQEEMTRRMEAWMKQQGQQ